MGDVTIDHPRPQTCTETEGDTIERIIAAMAFLEHDQPPYIFHIRSPRYSRALGLFLLAVFVAPSVYVGSKIGLGWFPSNLLPVLFYMATMVGEILFASWILFLPRSTLARIEFTRDRVRFIPNPSHEVLASSPKKQLCQHSQQKFSSAIASCRKRSMDIESSCAADGAERELASHSPHTQVDLNASEIDRWPSNHSGHRPPNPRRHSAEIARSEFLKSRGYRKVRAIRKCGGGNSYTL